MVDRPFYRLLGIDVVRAADGVSLVHLPERAELTNSRGEVHGGAIASLLDAALASAVRSSLEEGSGAATITLTTTYIAPGHGALTGHGRVLRAGGSIVSAEARVEDAAGRLVAQALGTLRALPRHRQRA
jgi:uncharacterized protein (TIGR00369 family)